MNLRIKELRKALDQTQTEFATAIGISRSALTKIESGENAPSTQSIQFICKLFNVNEEWLKNGTGEMFNEVDRYEELGKYVSQLSKRPPDDFQVRLVLVLAKLPSEKWGLLEEIAEDLAKKYE